MIDLSQPESCFERPSFGSCALQMQDQAQQAGNCLDNSLQWRLRAHSSADWLLIRFSCNHPLTPPDELIHLRVTKLQLRLPKNPPVTLSQNPPKLGSVFVQSVLGVTERQGCSAASDRCTPAAWRGPDLLVCALVYYPVWARRIAREATANPDVPHRNSRAVQ